MRQGNKIKSERSIATQKGIGDIYDDLNKNDKRKN